MARYLVILFCLYGCSSVSNLNLNKQKKEILKLNAQQRENHFQKNAKAISDLSSDSFLVVDGGRMFKPKPASQLKSFESYFSQVNFIKWDDVKEPEIRFSKDASIAYVAVEKIVILKGIGAGESQAPDTTYFAWISIYKKTTSGWKIDAIASTRKTRL